MRIILPVQMYRESNLIVWESDPTILGYTIHLSNTLSKRVKIVRCDMCKLFAGNYPVWFKWKGWHDKCICYITPIQLEDEIFAKYTRLIAHGEDTVENIEKIRLESVNLVVKPPQSLIDWINENILTKEDFESAPHWVTENFDYK